MKLLITACLAFLTISLFAQPKVIFDYDAAGNRTMRYRVTSINILDGETEEVVRLNKETYKTKSSFTSDEINISPNPTTDVVTIEVKTNGSPAKIMLYDADMKAVRKAQNVKDIQEFDIRNLSAGTYYCRIETELKIGVWQIIKVQ